MNAGSGRGGAADAARRIERVLAEAGRPTRMTLARHGRDIRPAAERAVKEGTAGLVAAGGDGTVNTLAGVAVDAGVPLGVLPQGTLNHFAKDLGIPTDLDEALEVVLAGHTRRVDVGEASLLLVNLELHLPVATSTGVQAEDCVQLITSTDPDLLARRFTIKELAHKTDATARRCGLQEVTS